VDERMTIDDLARRAGMTVRNVRAHQTRGLVPPPELRGRTGYYGPEHLARLRLIRDMRSAGFNLGAIKNLLDAAPPGAGEELLEFERALMAPWGPEESQVFAPDELLEMFGNPPPEIVQRAIEVGLIVPRDDGRVEVPMPTLLRAGREIAEVGVAPEKMLEVLESLLQHVRAISASFINLFLEGVWRRFESRGAPAEEWPRVRQALDRLRPLASDALAAAFHQTMKAAVEDAFGREIERRSRSEREAG
jgi:DNA-binding transcriptional MerR regulator